MIDPLLPLCGSGGPQVKNKPFEKGAFFPQRLGLLGDPDHILQNSA